MIFRALLNILHDSAHPARCDCNKKNAIADIVLIASNIT